MGRLEDAMLGRRCGALYGSSLRECQQPPRHLGDHGPREKPGPPQEQPRQAARHLYTHADGKGN